VQVEFVRSIASDAELYGRMKSASMLVLPSEREGYGLVVAEAQAAGTVPIVVRGPDNAAVDLVDDGRTGFVTGASVPELGAAIRRVLQDEGHREALGRRAMEVSLTRDWSAAAEATAVLYEDVRWAHAGSRGEGVLVGEVGG
jgi:glycosyltransferase involved in cell wall biosynthesis